MRMTITATLTLAFLSTFVPAAGGEALDPAPGVSLAKALESLSSSEKGFVVGVDCDAGGSLADAAKDPRRRLIIWFTGTCVGDVEIKRDDVTVRGVGDDPTVVGGEILVDASLRVRLRGFTVREPGNQGIAILHGSSVEVRDVEVIDTEQRGILIEESAAELIDVATHTTLGGTVGILNRASTLTLDGRIESSGSVVAGLSATLGARYFINGATLVMSNNGGSGVIFQINSSVTFSNGRLEANNNGGSGIAMATGAILQHGEIEIVANNNGLAGILISEFASWSPFFGFSATMEISGNAFAGVIAQETASFVIRGGTQTITDNGNLGVGVAAHGRLTLNGATTISGNPGGNVLVSLDSLAMANPGNSISPPVICGDTSTVLGLNCDAVIEGMRSEVAEGFERARAEASRAPFDM